MAKAPGFASVKTLQPPLTNPEAQALASAFDVDTATDLRRLHAELSVTQGSSRTAALVCGPLAGRLAS